ncbi:MAG: cellulase [Pseudoxanthomonas sp.]
MQANTIDPRGSTGTAAARTGAWRTLFGIAATACLLLSGAAVASDPAPYLWRNAVIGGGGFVTGIAYHPRERGLAYARTDVGGAYRWDAAASRWVPLTDWIGDADDNLFGIESLALDPSDPSRVYLAAGTYMSEHAGNGAILRSADRGASFERSDLPFKLGGNELARGNGERLAVDPNDGRILLFGSRRDGLWRSEDHGAHWRKLAGFPAVASGDAATAPDWNGGQAVGIVLVAFDAASGRPGAPTPRIYAGVSTTSAPALYVSDDAGASWRAVEGQPSGLRPTRMANAGNGSWFIACADLPGPNQMGNGALWKYAPADATPWRDVTPAPQSSDLGHDGFGWGAVAVDPRDPDVVIASTFNRFAPHDEIFRSSDGGRSWTPLLEGAAFDHSAVPWTAHATPHWIADLAIDPFDADEAMFVTGYGIWASRNLASAGGKPVQWWFKDAGLEETVPLALLSPGEGAPLLSGVADIDGFRHDDLTRATLQFDGPRLTGTESLANAGRAPRVVVRSGNIRDFKPGQVRIAYSLDGGRSWAAFASEPPEGEGGGHVAVAADGKRVIWQPNKAGPWITADFGRHWQRVRGLPDTVVVEADRVDEGIYYALDRITGTLYVSGNGGVEFTRSNGGIGDYGDWFHPQLRPDPNRVGVVYIHAHWRGLVRWSAGKLERVAGVDFVQSFGLGRGAEGSEAPTLYVAGKVKGVTGLFRSDDDGRHWQRIDDNAHRFGRIGHVEGDARVHGRVYIAASGRGVLYGEPR